MVVAVDKAVVLVEHVGEAAGHARSEVGAGGTEHGHQAAGHVFAAVIAHALDHGKSARVAHREPLPGPAGREQPAAGGPVQTGVAHDRGGLGGKGGAVRRPQHDFAAGHALAHVVVGIAVQGKFQAAHVPGAEALAGDAVQLEAHRRLGHALVAPAAGDLAAQAGADGAVRVGQGVGEGAAAFFRDGRQDVGHHAFGQRPAVKRPVTVDRAVAGLGGQQRVRVEERAQVEPPLPLRDAGNWFEQVDPADQGFQCGHAECGQPLPGLAGKQAEEMDHPFHRAPVVVPAQVLALGGDAGGAVVQVADAQVLAAERHHGRGAEAEALRTEHGRLDHVQPGLEAAVGLQADLVAQVVGLQGLVHLGQPQLPGRTGVADGRDRAVVGEANDFDEA